MDSEQNLTEAEKLVMMKTRESEHDRIEGKYAASMHMRVTYIVVMAVVCVIAFFCSLCIGSVFVSPADVLKAIGHAIAPGLIDGPSQDYLSTVVINSRLPRTLVCLLTGISLAAAGTIMQGLLRNPLVSPFTLGVSTAASFGAAFSIVFLPSMMGAAYYAMYKIGFITVSVKYLAVTVLAFVFGMLSIVLVLKIANKRASQSTLVLSGVVISYLFQAGLSMAQYLSSDEALRNITNWLLGGIWNATWAATIIMAPVVICCLIYLERLALDINSLSAGDEIARNVGVDVDKMRKNGLIVATLSSATCVAFTGVIGFVGLMGPHMTRMAIGNDARFVIPGAALLGSAILMISDIVARRILYPQQLPVGVIMYILGGIFFIWMVTSKKMGGRL